MHQVRALVSRIQPGLVICFTLDNTHISMLSHNVLKEESLDADSRVPFPVLRSPSVFGIVNKGSGWGGRQGGSVKAHTLAKLCQVAAGPSLPVRMALASCVPRPSWSEQPRFWLWSRTLASPGAAGADRSQLGAARPAASSAPSPPRTLCLGPDLPAAGACT